MLRDRQYMRNNSGSFDDKARSGLTCLYVLIAINVVVFYLFFSAPQIKYHLEFSPQDFLSGAIWQPLTAIFIHADFFHLFFNMFSLYIFGGLVAPRIGARKFTTLFLISGLAGNFLWFALSMATDLPVSLLGASGAVMGVLITAAMMAPNIPMMILFIPFPIKLRTMAIVFFLLDVLQQLGQGNHGHVAYLAHIGGFLAGMIYTLIALKIEIAWNPLEWLVNPHRYNSGPNFSSGSQRSSNRSSMPDGWTYHAEEPNHDEPHFTVNGGFKNPPVSQRELDALLDKISRTGINSLSEYELARLRQVREQMRG